MNFLQLCQRTVRETGVTSGDARPTTVVGQSGEMRKIVEWVASAWNTIQLLHDDWRWMRAEGSGTVASAARYSGSVDFGLTRFKAFIADPDSPMSIYKTSLGVADEGFLAEIPWSLYRQAYLKGAQVNTRPREYAIDPADKLCLGPIPDAAGYTIRFEYTKSPQILALDADIPDLPGGDAMHLLIVWNALMLSFEFDEALVNLNLIQRRYRTLMDGLTRTQRGGGNPKVTFGQSAGHGPIA